MKSNSIETVKVDGGKVSFDWSSGEMIAEWDNGYKETWKRNSYSVDQKAEAFFMFTDQFERIKG